MSKSDKTFPIHKIDKKWVREEKRTFSEYPGLRSEIFGKEHWLELLQFYRDDIKWLLSLEHHKFWSHVIYAEKVHELLISFLKEFPPIFLKNYFLYQEDIKNLFLEVEHLVFLVFLRLSTEKESESCFIRNFGDIIYNNYLFTVPVILDICLIYGSTNFEIVKKMINNIITAAPDFLDDFQEIIPQFVHVLKTVKEKFLVEPEAVLKGNSDVKSKEVLDLVLYFYDSVATIQVFFELYSNVCQLFNKGELISEIVYFYSNILPKMLNYWIKRHSNKSSIVFGLIENARIDLLKIVKSIFDFVLSEATEEKNEEIVNEYLDLMMKLLSEPSFLYDYNSVYSVEFELENVIKNCQNVDLARVDHILKVISQRVNENEGSISDDISFEYPDDSGVKLTSLVTEIKDIFPDLEESFIRQLLNYYNNNTEKVIAAVLENLIPPDLFQNGQQKVVLESRGKHKNKNENFNKVLDDKEEINRIKERYVQLSYVADEIYDDEYDDTYDENLDVSVREGDEAVRRPFVIPRILRSGKGNAADVEDNGNEGYEVNVDGNDDDEDDGYEEEEEEEIMKRRREELGRDCFVENPAVSRERMSQRKSETSGSELPGRARGQNQRNQVLKSRRFKESHKSFIANHNRKKLASRKMA